MNLRAITIYDVPAFRNTTFLTFWTSIYLPFDRKNMDLESDSLGLNNFVPPLAFSRLYSLSFLSRLVLWGRLIQINSVKLQPLGSIWNTLVSPFFLLLGCHYLIVFLSEPWGSPPFRQNVIFL